MTAELRDVPPAPRPVRLGAVLWYRWPLLAAGALLTVYGGLVTLMLWFSAHGQYPGTDRELDDRSTRASGRVVASEPVGGAWTGGGTVRRVRYAFRTPDGADVEDSCYVPGPGPEFGSAVDIEHSLRPPYRSRVVGGRVVLVGSLSGIGFLAIVAPGLALLALWLRGAWSQWRLLRDGDLSVATPLAVRRIPRVTPGMLRVRFVFRDRHARLREGSHWVRERSRLGERLAACTDGGRSDRFVVVFDRRAPWRHRLIGRDDVRRPPSARQPEPAPGDPRRAR
ncbi:MAG: hypothetical protein IPM29_21780 [Planctomycetes bacterium]|nr:hypothetical protein [Planctomycetota bacterium]